MSDSARQAARPVRSLPDWAWALAAFIFPFGPFIALAAARVLRWWAAVLLVIGTCLIMALFVVAFGCNPHVPRLEHSCRLLGVFFFLVAVAQLQYSIGRKRDLWSRRARRVWWIFGILAISLFVLQAVDMALQILSMRH